MSLSLNSCRCCDCASVNTSKVSFKKQTLPTVDKVDTFEKANNDFFTPNSDSFEGVIFTPLFDASQAEDLYKALFEFVQSKDKEVLDDEVDFSKFSDLNSLLDYFKEQLKNKKPSFKQNTTIFNYNGKPFVSIVYKTVYDGLKAKYKPNLAFHSPNNPNEQVLFGLDNKDDLIVERPFDDISFYSNGARKRVHSLSDCGDYYITSYYNKDGSKPFLKNLLFKFLIHN